MLQKCKEVWQPQQAHNAQAIVSVAFGSFQTIIFAEQGGCAALEVLVCRAGALLLLGAEPPHSQFAFNAF